jgi:hypothetical protein
LIDPHFVRFAIHHPSLFVFINPSVPPHSISLF